MFVDKKCSIKWSFRIPSNRCFLLHRCMSLEFQQSWPSSQCWTCVGGSPQPKSVRKQTRKKSLFFEYSLQLTKITLMFKAITFFKIREVDVTRPSVHRAAPLSFLDPGEWYSAFQDSEPCLWTKPSPSPLPAPAEKIQCGTHKNSTKTTMTLYATFTKETAWNRWYTDL